MLHCFRDAAEAASVLRPSAPLLLLHDGAAVQVARETVASFPGVVAYAVKVCDREDLLLSLWEGGIREFDVASIHEVRQVLKLLPKARLHYMNPIKAPEDIAEAYVLGVRAFAYDCGRELHKIFAACGGAGDVEPVLRVAVPNDKATFPISGKFGCDPAEAPALLGMAAARGWAPGVTFHVGSQCEDATAWRIAVDIVCEAAVLAGIEPSVVDIGGGFPARYTGTEPTFAACVAEAKAALDRWFPGYRGVFQCEPGRVVAAPTASALVRVELRKGEWLYLNDGFYGTLSELKWMESRHPVRAHRPCGAPGAALAPFSFYGPTCDSYDAMPGPFMLPEDVSEGDWIEIGFMGAYSTVLAGRFNGFPPARLAWLSAAGEGAILSAAA